MGVQRLPLRHHLGSRMRSFIIGLVIFGIGWFAGAAYMRWSIAQMFAQGEGRAICEAVLSEPPR